MKTNLIRKILNLLFLLIKFNSYHKIDNIFTKIIRIALR